MIVEEAKSQWRFFYRPQELFEDVERPPDNPEVREARIRGRNRLTGQVDTIGMVYGKGFGKEWAFAMAHQDAEAFERRHASQDQADLKLLAADSGTNRDKSS